MTVEKFLSYFTKFAEESPDVWVYTDAGECGISVYAYIGSIKIESGRVLLGLLGEGDTSTPLAAKTVLEQLQKAEPSSKLMLDLEHVYYPPANGVIDIDVDFGAIKNLVEFDGQEPAEIFFYSNTNWDEEEEWDED